MEKQTLKPSTVRSVTIGGGVPERGSGFSVEAPEGVRFLTRSRVFTDDEVSQLEAAGPPSRAA
jgi:hypothetical protein